jgi:hypothetical protein
MVARRAGDFCRTVVSRSGKSASGGLCVLRTLCASVVNIFLKLHLNHVYLFMASLVSPKNEAIFSIYP